MSSMFGSPRTGIRVGSILVAAVLTACSSSDTASPTTTVASTSTSGAAATTADAPATTTTSPPTSVPDTTTVTTTPTTTTVTTTLPPTTTTTTTLPPTTTTTEPLAVQELLLRSDGIGAARFGAESEGVISYVTSILGGNTGDTGWVDPFSFADCGAGGLATVARRVDWGVLSLLFSDGSSYAAGRRHLIGFEYGRVGQIGDEPQGLRTPGGVTLGSRVVDLIAEFGDEVFVNAGEPELSIPDNFYVSDEFRGLLTGTAGDDVVTVVFGGYGCFE